MQKHRTGGSSRSVNNSSSQTSVTPGRNTGYHVQGTMARGDATLSPFIGLFKPYVYRGSQRLTAKERQQIERARQLAHLEAIAERAS